MNSAQHSTASQVRTKLAQLRFVFFTAPALTPGVLVMPWDAAD